MKFPVILILFVVAALIDWRALIVYLLMLLVNYIAAAILKEEDQKGKEA